MEITVNIQNGKKNDNALQLPAYALGMLRMNTPRGLLWFTPGLTPGYRSLWGYLPCYGIIFAYSASSSLIGHGSKFHAQMIQQIILELLANQKIQRQIYEYQQSVIVPNYCHTLNLTRTWQFINF